MAEKILVFIPTYNECQNVERIYKEIEDLDIDCHVLFIDDNSPDGTGVILDKMAKINKNLVIQHRSGKEGIGSAHLCGISYAYEHGYDLLITMDADFTHNPVDIPKLLTAIKVHDVVVGSRFVEKNSLPGWSFSRLMLTHFGHFLTRYLLGIQQDASGAFRVYNLQNIPQDIFKKINSKSYSFFFESLLLLKMNGCLLNQIPITLFARTYGHSKLNFKEALQSGIFLIKLSARKLINQSDFQVEKKLDSTESLLFENEEWNSYWQRKKNMTSLFYGAAASIYRRMFIKPHLQHHIKKNFDRGSKLLHAGCGSGQVDIGLHHNYTITAVDLSSEALLLYSKNNPNAGIEQADILNLELKPNLFDGIYNLGVFEHFSHDEIKKILGEFKKILKPDGKIVIFWPHRYAWSVFVLKIAHYILNNIFKKNIRLHPAEPSLLRGKKSAQFILSEASFELINYTFNIKDLFVQAVVVAMPLNN